MERELYIVTQGGEEAYIGRVQDVLLQSRNQHLELAMRDIVDSLVFTEDKEYAVLTLEIR
jgi:hypothetical protein